ncbi:pentapeptide repeat-containing protein [Carbonactinospora thermoautotrophica]|uniref:pentapeptide repeat-containing protein n=1 Tax=Carbonactinospora thermoautotrophica TaxID=1469144 RepID=UPI002272156E|nr:pentapeptide repeat-containing protein [Carbonactinospora thermoautotrophica]
MGALVFTGWQTRLIQQQNLTQALGQAVDQLDSDQLSVRLLGIHTLGRVLRDSPPDRQAIAQGLSRFIRERAPATPAAKPGETSPTSIPKPLAEDVQTALSVLAHAGSFSDVTDADVGDISQYIDLHATNLIDANLFDADLTGANLSGADLSGVDLSKTWGLTPAQVEKARTDAATKLPPPLQGKVHPDQ